MVIYLVANFFFTMSKRKRNEWVFGFNDIPERTKRRYSNHTVEVQESHSSSSHEHNLAHEACCGAAIERGRNSCVQDESGDSSDVNSSASLITDTGDKSDVIDIVIAIVIVMTIMILAMITMVMVVVAMKMGVVIIMRKIVETVVMVIMETVVMVIVEMTIMMTTIMMILVMMVTMMMFMVMVMIIVMTMMMTMMMIMMMVMMMTMIMMMMMAMIMVMMMLMIDDDDDDDDNGGSDVNERLVQFIYKSQIPLYPSSASTLFDYQLTLLQFSLKHCLTKKEFSDLLKLVPSFFPHKHNAISSYFKHKKFWKPLLNESQLIRKHKYCTVCHHLMVDTDNELCPNECDTDFENFVMCDLGLQIKMLMEGMLIIVQCM